MLVYRMRKKNSCCNMSTKTRWKCRWEDGWLDLGFSLESGKLAFCFWLQNFKSTFLYAKHFLLLLLSLLLLQSTSLLLLCKLKYLTRNCVLTASLTRGLPFLGFFFGVHSHPAAKATKRNVSKLSLSGIIKEILIKRKRIHWKQTNGKRKAMTKRHWICLSDDKRHCVRVWI